MFDHAGEYSYACTERGKQFKGNDKLKVHMRTLT